MVGVRCDASHTVRQMAHRYVTLGSTCVQSRVIVCVLADARAQLAWQIQASPFGVQSGDTFYTGVVAYQAYAPTVFPPVSERHVDDRVMSRIRYRCRSWRATACSPARARNSSQSRTCVS
jgi:hypothetical protein